MQFKLLLDLDVVANFGLVLLELALVNRLVLGFVGVAAAARPHASRTLHAQQVVVPVVRGALQVGLFARLALAIISLLFVHLHVHEDLDGGLYVLNDREGVDVFELVALDLERGLVVGVDLTHCYRSKSNLKGLPLRSSGFSRSGRGRLARLLASR